MREFQEKGKRPEELKKMCVCVRRAINQAVDSKKKENMPSGPDAV